MAMLCQRIWDNCINWLNIQNINRTFNYYYWHDITRLVKTKIRLNAGSTPLHAIPIPSNHTEHKTTHLKIIKHKIQFDIFLKLNTHEINDYKIINIFSIHSASAVLLTKERSRLVSSVPSRMQVISRFLYFLCNDWNWSCSWSQFGIWKKTDSYTSQIIFFIYFWIMFYDAQNTWSENELKRLSSDEEELKYK